MTITKVIEIIKDKMATLDKLAKDDLIDRGHSVSCRYAYFELADIIKQINNG
jgi:hypothetical protein